MEIGNTPSLVLTACDDLLQILKSDSISSSVGREGGGAQTSAAEDLVVGLLRMKAGNREAMALLERREAAVAAQRERNDQARLRLENLLYRQAYLAREIRACDDFSASAAATVEKELGGEPLLQQTHTADLAARHKRSLNRLAEEFESRRDKRAALAELRAAHAEETSALDKKRRFLEELPSRLKDVAAAVAQVEQHALSSGGCAAPGETAVAAMAGIGRSAVLEAAASLPGPLYTLYYGLNALQVVISSTITSTGEVLPGYVLFSEHCPARAADSPKAATQWAFRASIVDTPASNKAVDLDLRISLTGEGSNAPLAESVSATLRFSLGQEHLVCVSVQGLSFASAYPFKPDELLHNLFPGDSSASGSFLWLQWVCGLRPLPPPAVQTSTTRYGSSLGTVVHRVRNTLPFDAFMCRSFLCVIIIIYLLI
jgi:hypothetical protein